MNVSVALKDSDTPNSDPLKTRSDLSVTVRHSCSSHSSPIFPERNGLLCSLFGFLFSCCGGGGSCSSGSYHSKTLLLAKCNHPPFSYDVTTDVHHRNACGDTRVKTQPSRRAIQTTTNRQTLVTPYQLHSPPCPSAPLAKISKPMSPEPRGSFSLYTPAPPSSHD